jgi:hypothetical protein
VFVGTARRKAAFHATSAEYFEAHSRSITEVRLRWRTRSFIRDEFTRAMRAGLLAPLREGEAMCVANSGFQRSRR